MRPSKLRVNRIENVPLIRKYVADILNVGVARIEPRVAIGPHADLVARFSLFRYTHTMLLNQSSGVVAVRRRLVGTLLLAAVLSCCGGQTDSPAGSSSTGGSIGLESPGSGGASSVSDLDAGIGTGLYCSGTYAADAAVVVACGESIESSRSCHGPVSTTSWPLCAGAQNLLLERRGESCRYALLNAPAEALTDRSLDHKLIVAIAPIVGDAAEVVTHLGGSETYCQQRLSASDSGWFLDFDVTPPEVGLCACSCARLAELGRLLVIYGCGSGPVWMG